MIEKIHHYYPIDKTQPFTANPPKPDWYRKTEEYHRLQKVIQLSNSEVETQKFDKFFNHLQQKISLPKKQVDTPMFPSQGGKFIVERIETEYVFLVRELYFYISSLLPYFIVYGISFVLEKESPFNSAADRRPKGLIYPAVFLTKPLGIYSVPFTTAIKEIQVAYPDYELLPWYMATKNISDRYISYVAEPGSRTVINALFNSVTFKYNKCIP